MVGRKSIGEEHKKGKKRSVNTWISEGKENYRRRVRKQGGGGEGARGKDLKKQKGYNQVERIKGTTKQNG